MQRDFYTVKACTEELLRPASVTVDPTDIQKILQVFERNESKLTGGRNSSRVAIRP